MKLSRITAAVLFGFTVASLVAGPEEAFVLPDALKSTVPEIPADQNNLTKFFTAFPKSTPEITKLLREAEERLNAGKDVDNQDLLEKLRKSHRLAKDLLKPPLSFTLEMEVSNTTSLIRLFQGAGVLGRQAMFEKDYSKADDLIGDMLEWSRLLRNARPNLVQALISRYGWKCAFNALLLDLANHPDQPKRLAEIKQFHAKNRIERAELMESLKSEALWSAHTGGLKKLLKDENYADMMTFYLKPPFNKLSAEDLLKLPYDTEAEFRREMNEMLGMLECLKKGTPMVHWPGYEIPVTGHTLEDYAKRPNGLGELYREQMDPSMRRVFWCGTLSHSPLVDACLHWLKLERDGKSIDESSFANWSDPIDGKPLAIDVKQRTIRSRGPNQKVDPPDPEFGKPPAAGFTIRGDDSVIVVPRWRTAAIDGGPESK